jgi:hypothetical protein
VTEQWGQVGCRRNDCGDTGRLEAAARPRRWILGDGEIAGASEQRDRPENNAYVGVLKQLAVTLRSWQSGRGPSRKTHEVIPRVRDLLSIAAIGIHDPDLMHVIKDQLRAVR